MDREGRWRLSPAYDLTYAHGSGYTRRHQLSLNRKREGIGREDLLVLGRRYGVKGEGRAIIAQVANAVGEWEKYAREARVPKERTLEIAREIRERAT